MHQPGTADVCTTCHGTGGDTPTAGLHVITPSETGETHDENLTGATDCTTCHSSVSATHINGTLVATDAILAGDVNYTQGSPSTCMPQGCISHRAI